jgi:osmotically inducible protein OsmC
MSEIERTASAVWTGTLREGEGSASTESGVLTDARMTFSTRFEDQPGGNPEELIGAAHASCFSMALAGALARGGTPPEEIRTTATVGMRKTEEGWRIVRVHLTTIGQVPGLDAEGFRTAAAGAKDNCPVSRLLAPGLESLTVAADLAGGSGASGGW